MLDAKGNSVSLKEEIIWAKRQSLDSKDSELDDNKPRINKQDKTNNENCAPNKLNVRLDFVQKQVIDYDGKKQVL